ncbi:hypothetical protein EKK58_02760 [Candidatus Dependentiae bacterium]|nr:MAG: hypothetical protein EKK58_02760 [Candidatus Dependentiae bacterium]
MGKYIKQVISNILFVCIAQFSTTVHARVHNPIYNIKKEFATLKSKHHAVNTLQFLIEQYELYASAYFVQEYASECNQVLNAITTAELGDHYKYVTCLFFQEICRLSIVSLQYKYAHVMLTIQKAISYWSYQYEHPWLYACYKNPLKWFAKQSANDEIHEHLLILERMLEEYTIKLGSLINYSSLLLNDSKDVSLENISKVVQEVRLYYINCRAKNNDNNMQQLSCVNALSMLADDLKYTEDLLLKRIKEHSVPNHLERYWLHYFIGFGLGYLLFRQKNNAISLLNNFIQEHHLVQYEQNFIKSFKKHVVLPFKQLGNVLFGVPLDIAGNYPERFDSLVQVYNQDHRDAFELASRGYDKLPFNFDIEIVVPYKWPKNDLKGYQLLWKLFTSNPLEFESKNMQVAIPTAVEWTEEEKKIFFQTNQIAGYALYKLLSAKSDTLLTFLNMSHEIDLILKVIAIMPALGLVYAAYKTIRCMYIFARHTNYEPLHTILIDMQECIIDGTDKYSINKDKINYSKGKLFFLKYYAKKSASCLLSRNAYKAFLKDLKKVHMVPDEIDNTIQMIELIIKKYNLKSMIS